MTLAQAELRSTTSDPPPTPFDSDWQPPAEDAYRYHLDVKPAPDLSHLPSRFLVEVSRFGLAKLLVEEMLHFRGHAHFKSLVTSRPCVYGVFSGPVGGFAPRPKLCVGCLRCTTQHPEFVRILPNPERKALGDSFLSPSIVEAILHESATGTVPVKGQGYRGRMGGPGWDGMWTDMSEIVRPTRDGIHGREFISTVVDLGRRAAFLEFGEEGELLRGAPAAFSLPLPMIFDLPDAALQEVRVMGAVSAAARDAETLAIVPIKRLLGYGKGSDHLVPRVNASNVERLEKLKSTPRLIELEASADAAADRALIAELREAYPESRIALRLPMGAGFEARLAEEVEEGIGIVHLTADYHGRGGDGRFVLGMIRSAQEQLVASGLRDKVTLIGSGGIVAAEHVPKAILCGLDLVGIDSAALAAMQAVPQGEAADREAAVFEIPGFEIDWGHQRLVNLLASWRDQLLEIMGAMGLREVRRLRGEFGRAMFQRDLEKEAFSDIRGFVPRDREDAGVSAEPTGPGETSNHEAPNPAAQEAAR